MRLGSRFKRVLLVSLFGVLFQVFLLTGPGEVIPSQASDNQLLSDKQGAPRIEVDRDFVDYGTVPLEQRIEHSTIIMNVGDAPLKIENICHNGIIHTKALEGC